jgi:hypothetical protein
MRMQNQTDFSPGARRYQRVLRWMLAVGVIAAITFFVVMLILLRAHH